MKLLAFYLSILLLAIETSLGGINDELVSLFSARHAAAMVPAKEGRIDDVDPWMDDKTFGMIFDTKNAFSLEKDSFEKALSSAKIQAWTLAQEAPWSPGKKSSWVVLDYGGQPFLSITLMEDQPELILVRQVIGFSEGVATLGRTQHRYFRCELVSKDLVQFLTIAAKNRSGQKFLPEVQKSE